MSEWSWEGTDYNTISLMLNIGNETYPSSVSDLVNQSEAEPPDLDQSEDDQGWEHIRVAVVAILAGIISFLTIVGNIMVMVSFKIDKQLQTISNYFLFSLAVADLIIGAFSVPLFAVMYIKKSWIFSRHFCDAWLAIDYLASNASVWNLMVISIDRYFSVTRPLSYRATRTTMKALLMISGAWGLSCVMWVIPIYVWQYIEGSRIPDDECYVQFVETSRVMSVTVAVMAFYLPVTIMCCLYVRVWWETVKRQRDLVHLQAGKKMSKRSTSSGEQEDHIFAATRLSVGTFQSQGENEASRRRLFRLCLLCLRRPRSRSQPSLAGGQHGLGSLQVSAGGQQPRPGEEAIRLTASRSFNALCGGPGDNNRSGDRKWNNGYRSHQSRSTDNLLDEIKNCNGDGSDSVYTILIQFPAMSLPDTAADTTSITMLSDTDINSRPPSRQNRCSSNSRGSAMSKTSSGLSGLEKNCVNSNSISKQQQKLRSYSCIPDTIDLNARIVPKSYVKSVSQPASVPASSLPRKNKMKKATQEKRQERKAAKTLSAILLVFILTWTPYNVLAVMKGILGPEQSEIIPDIVWNIAYFLCYINSTINPFCYALCNAAFRRTYIRILTFKWRSSQKQPVNTYYYG